MKYSFTTFWYVEAPISEVWDAIYHPLRWPSWWKNVKKVVELKEGDADGVGADGERVAHAVLAAKAERGILLCGSGVGASVAANKFKGIRCALCSDTFSARQGVEDDSMNVLAIGARVIGPALAAELVAAFLRATFSNAERHRRRLDKVLRFETRKSDAP